MSTQFPTPQMQAASSTPLRLATKKKRLTHTNTDRECLRKDAGFLRRLIYTIDIHNGFKFFSIAERTVLYVIIWLCCTIIATYSYVFLQGMYDGITTLPLSSSTETSTVASSTAAITSDSEQ
jgi:hypothetical protein